MRPRGRLIADVPAAGESRSELEPRSINFRPAPTPALHTTCARASAWLHSSSGGA